jgi:type I restriction enzyme R subunit
MATRGWNEKKLVEDHFIKQVKDMGYKHVKGVSIKRGSQREVVLIDKLTQAIKRINPWINDSNLKKVIRSITHMESTSLMEANEAFHDLLLTDLTVIQNLDKGKKNQTVKLIDFDHPEHNEFLVVDQLSIVGDDGSIKPDLILYVNGLPLVMIECKSPIITDPRNQAIKQLQRYQEQAERAFHYNLFLIATCGQNACVGTIYAKGQDYADWKDPWPLRLTDINEKPNPQEVLVASMLHPERLLDIIRNFIVYEVDNGKTIKKLARYQQYRAVNKTIKRVLEATELGERGGVIWHTQGSGKSLTMLYLAVKLRRIATLQNPTIIVVTDRRDLDTQISNTFHNCNFPNPLQADNIEDLRLLLRRPGATILTTVQKFQERESSSHPLISEDENIFVLVDESHRTQYKNLALNMRLALPNACYIGFTGTPIDKKDKSTIQTFGPYIDQYTIQQAVEDNATVPIFYEGRMAHLHVWGETLDTLFDRMFRDYSERDRSRIRKKYANEEAIVSAPQRVEQICLDLIDHYEKFIQPNGFKAQIVTISRETAVLYKETLEKLQGPESAIIFSGEKSKDKKEIKKYLTTLAEEKELINRFKKPYQEDKLAFLIVVNKLLTGFDAPIEQVMYLDRPLKEHNLLQAIARVNRKYDKKTYGLIIDYFGVSSFLTKALEVFHQEDVQGVMHSFETEIHRLESRHRVAMNFFQHVDHNDLEACIGVLEPKDIRHDFDQAFMRFSKSVDMISPDKRVAPYLGDLHFLTNVRIAARNRYRDIELDISDCGEKVKGIIKEYLRASKVMQLHEPIDILSSRFDQEIQKLPTNKAKASEMEHALRHEINIKFEGNPVFYLSLRERIENIIRARKEKRANDMELIEVFQDMMTDLRTKSKQAELKGYTQKEFPFYQLLVKVLGEEGYQLQEVKEVTNKILQVIKDGIVMEWIDKPSIQKAIRSGIKRHLRHVKYKGKLDTLTTELENLAMVHFRDKE